MSENAIWLDVWMSLTHCGMILKDEQRNLGRLQIIRQVNLFRFSDLGGLNRLTVSIFPQRYLIIDALA